MKKVRMAIVGTGSMGNCHGADYQKIPEIELVACCDVNEEAVK